ncbi:hypothetical protein A9W98_24630 [Mycobacterium gordonae]|jgi:anti-anti-sigma factor|uniref:Anti-sigma factor antagonist n=1 Tax=Mycobacterium gordonae TaxID=1778 RepID=A0A1A6BDS5_MYCGO|nr:STAS domain-containing protein [Mycobacterium gordonae]MBI2701743.1 STAS domain-containing protein [Mycobacterium sp.]MBX9980459.1 STAS domain-containing protein [Mycobacterium gordonae]MCQ4361218.1 STAS domain-containing protein [Mycobacterium gordonae]OBS00522.1 hypothetical protein A9W98_24630 [Mycobacterium gordonae]
MNLLTVDHQVQPEAVVVRAVGEVDVSTVDEMVRHLIAGADAASAHPAALLIADLSAVTFLASAGLQALLDCQEKCQSVGATLHVVANQPAVVRPLKLTGLDRAFRVYAAFSDALPAVEQESG